MRKSFILIGLLLFSAGATKAQEGRGFEVTGAYQYVRIHPGSGSSAINCQGGAGSLGAYLNASFGVIGEFGACKVTGLPSGTTSHEMNFLFGPRVYFHRHGRVYPYVQTLIGSERLSAGATGLASSSSNAFAMTAGGGADVTLTKHVSLRAFQFEYLYTHFSGNSQNNLRLQSGIVWRIGR